MIARVAVCVAAIALVLTTALGGTASATSTQLPDEIVAHMTPGAPISHTPEHISYPRGAPLAGPAPGPTPLTAYRMQCQGGWQPVQSYPGGYVTGNCYSGWSIDVVLGSGTITDPNSLDYGHFFWGGTIGGTYNGCGWVRDDYVLNTGPTVGTTTCSSPTIGAATIGILFNCAPGNCTGPTTVTTTVAGCLKYNNFRPWSTSNAPSGTGYLVNRNTPLAWRYYTRNQYGGTYWAEVLNYAPAAGEARWGFIPVSCVYNAPPGPGGYWGP